MNRSDRKWEETERRVDRMDGADLIPWQIKFAEENESAFFDWLREQVLAEVEADAADVGYGEP